MFVEQIYDKRNMSAVPDAKGLVLPELTKRVHRTFPDADVRVKPMVSLSSIITDASKAQKAIQAVIVDEMFDDAGEWLDVD
ncbi:MAG: DinI-like family protein [Rouxiella aceris]|uniref:DinI-like family protein n=1 Tax=Rouxiella aceris TaxID=2703884 RepID=UPI00283E1DDC|nr:DinI-like family protein [Rouxiella aceris]MDR3431573.1 DinI-like family protein [Rouxiella aceris]